MGAIFTNHSSDYKGYLRCDSKETGWRLIALYFEHGIGSAYGPDCGYDYNGSDNHPVLQAIPLVTADMVTAIASEADEGKRNSMLDRINGEYEVLDIDGKIGALSHI